MRKEGGSDPCITCNKKLDEIGLRSNLNYQLIICKECIIQQKFIDDFLSTQ